MLFQTIIVNLRLYQYFVIDTYKPRKNIHARTTSLSKNTPCFSQLPILLYIYVNCIRLGGFSQAFKLCIKFFRRIIIRGCLHPRMISSRQKSLLFFSKQDQCTGNIRGKQLLEGFLLKDCLCSMYCIFLSIRFSPISHSSGSSLGNTSITLERCFSPWLRLSIWLDVWKYFRCYTDKAITVSAFSEFSQASETADL